MSLERYHHLPAEERLSYLTKHDVRKSRFGRKGVRRNDHGTAKNPTRWEGETLVGPELDKWKSEKAKHWRTNFSMVEDKISDRKYEEKMLDQARDLCDEGDWNALMALDPNIYDPSKDFKTPVRRGVDPSIPWFSRSNAEVGRFGTNGRKGRVRVVPAAWE